MTSLGSDFASMLRAFRDHRVMDDRTLREIEDRLNKINRQLPNTSNNFDSHALNRNNPHFVSLNQIYVDVGGDHQIMRPDDPTTAMMTLFNGGQIRINPTAAQLGQPSFTVYGDWGNHVVEFANIDDAAGDGVQIRLGSDATMVTGNAFARFVDGAFGTDGQIRADGSGGTAYVTTSDRRLKRNIEDLAGALDLLMRLRPRSFERVENPGVRRIGFVAQELFEVYPQAAFPGKNEDMLESGQPQHPWSVDLAHVVPVLVAAVQEQQKKIADLEDRLLDQKYGLLYRIKRFITKIVKR